VIDRDLTRFKRWCLSLEPLSRSDHAPGGESPVMRAPGSARALPLEELPLRHWTETPTPADRDRALRALESGKIVFLRHLAFDIRPAERRFFDPLLSDGKAKNISFDPRTGAVGGTRLAGHDREELAALLRRFGRETQALLVRLFPRYAPHLQPGRASLRPVSIDTRQMSVRQDDRRLHIDAFPSQPAQGRRILRVFANANADGAARIWRVGEPFAEHARRLLRRRPYVPPGVSALLATLRITKGRRTPYDWLMLSLHDRAKADLTYQRDGASAEIRFPAGSIWIVFTDCVPHAAIGGQHALEQTFSLPVAVMRRPALAPLSILEHLLGRPLAG
jgi:hypothetical protein